MLFYTQKTILYLSFSDKCACRKCQHFWWSVLSSSLVLSRLTTAFVVILNFFLSSRGSRYALEFQIGASTTSVFGRPTSQLDDILCTLCSESALLWIGRLQVSLFSSSYHCDGGPKRVDIFQNRYFFFFWTEFFWNANNSIYYFNSICSIL